jgi:hypothetical protein
MNICSECDKEISDIEIACVDYDLFIYCTECREIGEKVIANSKVPFWMEVE